LLGIGKFKKLLAILLSRSSLWYRALFRFGVAPSTEHLPVLRSLHVDTFIDIGANRGQFALAAIHVFPDSTIFSFEPLPDARRGLDSLFESIDAVNTYEVAIGNEGKEEVINISKKEDSSSLLEITEKQSEIFPGTEKAGSARVQVKRLSDCISSDDLGSKSFLKIDVQGYELEVLLGASELLSRLSYIYVECSFVHLYKNQATASQIIKFLGVNRFILNGIYNVSYDVGGVAVQADFLFIKEE